MLKKIIDNEIIIRKTPPLYIKIPLRNNYLSYEVVLLINVLHKHNFQYDYDIPTKFLYKTINSF